jgi:putative transposase
LWRAVDQDGYVLDEIAQVLPAITKAARRLLTRLMKKQGIVPRRTSSAMGRQSVMSSRISSIARGEFASAGSKTGTNAPGLRSIGSLQHFVSLFSAVRNLFVPGHTKPSANQIRNHRLLAMAQWKAVSGKFA